MTGSLAFLALQSQELLSFGVEKIYTIAGMNIGKWVRAARKSAGLTQAQLGDVVGRSKANVGHWETGSHEPSFDQIMAISRATGHPLPADGSNDSAPNAPLNAIKGARKIALGNLSNDAVDIARMFDRMTNEIDREYAYSSAIGLFAKILSDRVESQKSVQPAEEANPAPIQSDPVEKLHV